MLTGQGGWLETAQMCSHCLLVETSQGLTLVDTGFGVNEVLRPQSLGHMFNLLMQPTLKLEETAVYQLDKMGIRRNDIKHIILTHLDMDHAGGLSDFPDAKVYTSQIEIDAALAPRGWKEKQRYIPSQFAHNPKWQTVESTGESWFGFKGVQHMKGFEDNILLIPLAGHTRGHTGVAIKQPNNKWLFHVGDLYMDRRSLFGRSPLMLRQCENLLAENNRARLKTLAQVKRLIQLHAGQVDVFCAHDQQEFNSFITE